MFGKKRVRMPQRCALLTTMLQVNFSSIHMSTSFTANVPQLVPGEYFSRIKGELKVERGKTSTLTSIHSSLPFLLTFIVNFRKPGGMVMDTFYGTISTDRACLSMNKPRKIVGGDVDTA